MINTNEITKGLMNNKMNAGGLRNARNNDLQTESHDVLSNAVLPGIFYGWGVRLLMFTPQNSTIISCLIDVAICPGAESSGPRFF